MFEQKWGKISRQFFTILCFHCAKFENTTYIQQTFLGNNYFFIKNTKLKQKVYIYSHIYRHYNDSNINWADEI